MSVNRRFSPCKGVCSATALGDPICKGCGRTQDEVVHWNQMSPEEREAVWERLEGRDSQSE